KTHPARVKTSSSQQQWQMNGLCGTNVEETIREPCYQLQPGSRIQVVDLKRQKERNGSKGSALETLGWEFSVEKGMGKKDAGDTEDTPCIQVVLDDGSSVLLRTNHLLPIDIELIVWSASGVDSFNFLWDSYRSICAPHRLQAPCLAVPTLPEALVPSDSSLQGLLPQSQPPRASPRTSPRPDPRLPKWPLEHPQGVQAQWQAEFSISWLLVVPMPHFQPVLCHQLWAEF
ncbi:unnamed protein product, partial [Cladocopium goreaui]